MTDRELEAMTPFEERLGRDLRALSGAALRPDAVRMVAAGAVATGRPRPFLARGFPRRIVLAGGLALLVLAVGMALVAGSFRMRTLAGSGRLAYETTTDRSGNGAIVHVVARDGSGADIAS